MSRIVGIDLGTSTSEIAFINNEKKPELMPNNNDKIITPSIVYIDENHNPVVGEKAKEMSVLEPENTIVEVKRLMGTENVLNIRGKTYTPQQISSFILAYLKECAESHLGEIVERAVITVPAYFTDAQRKATVEAGELAGFKVERIINEPTAASLDYGILHLDDCKNIVIYDLGGGTLDVTVLELFEGIIDVKSTCGNNKLGGLDFDNALINHLIDKCKVEYGLNPSEDKRAFMRLKNISEECKIALSKEEEFYIELPFLMEKDGQPIGINETISRDKFESLISGLIESTLTQLKTALREAKLSVGDIDLFLLVGGSTKIPLVSKLIETELNVVPKMLVDPDLAVVKGAAIQSGIIDKIFGENGIIITDICPYTLSTEALHDSLFGGELYCVPIIPKNTTIPVKKEQIFSTASDGQTLADITVYQGESQNADENILLGEFTLTGIPPRKAHKEKIVIEFSYDLNGILVSRAKVVSSESSAEIIIDMNKVEPIKNKHEDIDISNWEQFKVAKKYKAVIRKAEKLLDISQDEELDELLKLLKQSIVLEKDPMELNFLKQELLEIIYELEDENE